MSLFREGCQNSIYVLIRINSGMGSCTDFLLIALFTLHYLLPGFPSEAHFPSRTHNYTTEIFVRGLGRIQRFGLKSPFRKTN